MAARITIPQLQALVAIADHGSFSAAGIQLNIAQSAISRNIHELESCFQTPLFNRDRRSAALTLEGIRVTVASRDVLRKWVVICEEFAKPTLLHRTLRIGITEIAAQTWLPRFVTSFRSAYPWVELLLEVSAMASELVEKVRRGHLDLAMASDSAERSGVVSLPLGSMRCGWYCRVDFPAPKRAIPLSEMMSFPLVMQDNASAAGRRVSQWLESQGALPTNVIYSNSFAALGGMTVAGLGIGCLPHALAKELIACELVREVKTSPKTPRMQYVTFIRDSGVTPFLLRVADLAVKVCDYDVRYQEVSDV